MDSMIDKTDWKTVLDYLNVPAGTIDQIWIVRNGSLAELGTKVTAYDGSVSMVDYLSKLMIDYDILFISKKKPSPESTEDFKARQANSDIYNKSDIVEVIYLPPVYLVKFDRVSSERSESSDPELDEFIEKLKAFEDDPSIEAKEYVSDDDIEGMACQLLINSKGCDWKRITALKKVGFDVFAGEADSFGWLTGCIRTKKGVIVYG